MDEPPKPLSEARDSMDTIFALATALLLSGANVEHVHQMYVAAAFDLLAEAEAQALLAARGDRIARLALKRVVRQLSHLREQAQDELSRYARDMEP